MSTHNCSYKEFRAAFDDSATVRWCDDGSILLDSGSYKIRAYTTFYDITFRLVLILQLKEGDGITKFRTITIGERNVEATLVISRENTLYPLSAEEEEGEVAPVVFYIERKPTIDVSLLKRK